MRACSCLPKVQIPEKTESPLCFSAYLAFYPPTCPPPQCRGVRGCVTVGQVAEDSRHCTLSVPLGRGDREGGLERGGGTLNSLNKLKIQIKLTCSIWGKKKVKIITKSDIFENNIYYCSNLCLFLIPDPGFSFYTNKYQSHSYAMGCSMQCQL